VLLVVSLLLFHDIPVRQQLDNALAFCVAFTAVYAAATWLRSRSSAR
jgi:hypothetical protein